MALTRGFLKALNVEEAAIQEIINAHTETTSALKEQRDSEKARADKLEAVQKEFDAFKEKVKTDYVAKADFDKLTKEYTDYKSDISAKETKNAINGAVSAYLEGKNIKGDNLKLALMALDSKMSGFELDADKKLKSTKVLDDLIAGDFKSLVSTTTKIGADIPHGIENAGTAPKTPSRAAQLAAQYHDSLYGSVDNGAKTTTKGE